MLDEVAPLGGRGGLIAITSDGDFVMPFQTRLMYRGYWKNGETKGWNWAATRAIDII